MTRLFTLLAAVLLAGCATTKHQFAAPGPGWKTATGQMKYKGSGVTIIGDLTVSRGPGGARAEFTKGGALSLMRVQADAARIRFEGPLARGTREFAAGGSLPKDLAAWRNIAWHSSGRQTLAAGDGGETLTYQLPPLR